MRNNGRYVRVRIANNIIDNNEDILYFLGDDSTRLSNNIRVPCTSAVVD